MLRCVKAHVPSNAHLDESWLSSGGWRCNRGFRKVGDACMRIVLPDNAYLGDSTYGREWECERGFRAAGEHCVSVRVPVNGYLTGAGDDWKCERGFIKQHEACVGVVIPTNGYLGHSSRCRPRMRALPPKILQPVEKAPPPVFNPVAFHGNPLRATWSCSVKVTIYGGMNGLGAPTHRL